VASQDNAPDPTKITIMIEGHAESFIIDRRTTMKNCPSRL
jgi:hypothetical protein